MYHITLCISIVRFNFFFLKKKERKKNKNFRLSNVVSHKKTFFFIQLRLFLHYRIFSRVE